MLSDVERAVVEEINEAALVRLASELIAIPSVTGEESVAQECVGSMLSDIGASVDVWDLDLDALRAHAAYSAEVDRTRAVAVLGRLGDARPGAGVLLIDGHVDVVPPGATDYWDVTAPFAPVVKDGRLYGRGACDTKGGLAAAIHALGAITRAGVRLEGEVRVTPVVGEEDGGCGTLGALLAGAGGGASGCVILEPTELAVVPAVAGALSFRVRLRGLSAHGAIREEGVSAIEKLPFVQRALLDLEARRNAREADALFDWLDRPFAICAGRVEAGDWPSSEADWLVLEGRYGVAPDEDLDVAQREFEAAIAEAATGDPWLAEHPPVVEWWGGQFLPGRTRLDDPLVTTTSDAVADVTGTAASVRGMPYGCDMGLTTRVGGLPTVVFGPGDIRAAHRPDEHVAVDDLLTASRVLALAVLRTCGVAA